MGNGEAKELICTTHGPELGGGWGRRKGYVNAIGSGVQGRGE